MKEEVYSDPAKITKVLLEKTEKEKQRDEMELLWMQKSEEMERLEDGKDC